MTLFFFSAMAGKLPDGKKVDCPRNLEDLFDYASIETDKRDRYFGSFANTTPSLFSNNIDPKLILI